MISEVFYWVLNMSIVSTLTFFVVFLISRIKIIPKNIICILFSIPYLRMIIPFGFSCRLKNQSKIGKDKIFKIILAGPVTSFTVAGLVFLWTKEFALVNLIIGIFNLIPIGNLDGGRIFRILMQS